MREILQAEAGDDGYVVRLVADGRTLGAGFTRDEAEAWVAMVHAHGDEFLKLGGDAARIATHALRLKTRALDRHASGRGRTPRIGRPRLGVRSRPKRGERPS